MKKRVKETSFFKNNLANPMIIKAILLVGLLFIGEKIRANSEFDELMLLTGEQHVLDATNVASFSESTTGVIQVKVPNSGKKLIITAIRPGRTSLLLITKDQEQKKIPITVFSQNPSSIISEMSSLLKNQKGITFMKIGPRVFIDGNVNSQNEMERVKTVEGLYPGQVESLVRIGSNVEQRTNVRLDLVFLEINSSATLKAGVDWPSSLGANGSVSMTFDLMSGLPAATYRMVNQAVPAIHAAESSGYAKIKKRASLITTDGNSASYSSGGEINIPIAGSQAAELRTVSYGCTLTVLPILDIERGLIDLKVEAEISELRETSQDAPGRTISKVSTIVHLAIGQSIILSGLDSSNESLGKQGLPFLSRIPIIGMLFGTHRKHKEKTNGLIAITPVIVNNANGEHKRRLNSALKKFNEMSNLKTHNKLKPKASLW